MLRWWTSLKRAFAVTNEGRLRFGFGCRSWRSVYTGIRNLLEALRRPDIRHWRRAHCSTHANPSRRKSRTTASSHCHSCSAGPRAWTIELIGASGSRFRCRRRREGTSLRVDYHRVGCERPRGRSREWLLGWTFAPVSQSNSALRTSLEDLHDSFFFQLLLRFLQTLGDTACL